MITKQVTIRPHSKPAWTNRRSNEDPRQFWVKSSSWQGAIKLVLFKIKIQDLDGDEITIKIKIKDFSDEIFSRLEVFAVSRVVQSTWGWDDWITIIINKITIIINKIAINIIIITIVISASVRLQRCIATINRWTDYCNNREIIVVIILDVSKTSQNNRSRWFKKIITPMVMLTP